MSSVKVDGSKVRIFATKRAAQGHELMARTYDRAACVHRRMMTQRRCSRVDAVDLGAAGCDGAALGHLFRAAELRYDARGGLTLEQARRRHEPGAVWSRYGVRLVVAFQSYFQGEVWAHFPFRQPEELAAMTRENGWRLVAPAPAAPHVVSP